MAISVKIYDPDGAEYDITQYLMGDSLGDIHLQIEDTANHFVCDDLELSLNNVTNYFTTLWELPLNPYQRYNEATGKGAWMIKVTNVKGLLFEGDLDCSTVQFDEKQKTVSTTWYGASKRAEIPAEPELLRITDEFVYFTNQVQKRILTFYEEEAHTTPKTVASIGLQVGDRIKTSQLKRNGEVIDQELEIKIVGPTATLNQYQVKVRQGCKKIYTKGIVINPFWKNTPTVPLTYSDCVAKCFTAIGVPVAHQKILSGDNLTMESFDITDKSIADCLKELATDCGCVWFRETATGDWYFVSRDTEKGVTEKDITTLLGEESVQASDEDWYDAVLVKGRPPYFAPDSKGRAYFYGSGKVKTLEIETDFTSSMTILESIAKEVYARVCKIRKKIEVTIKDTGVTYDIWDKIKLGSEYYFAVEITKPLRVYEYPETIMLTLISLDGITPTADYAYWDRNRDDDAPYPPTDVELGKGTDKPADRPAWWSEFRSQYPGGWTEYPIKKVVDIVDDDDDPTTPPKVVVKRLWALRWKNEYNDDDNPDGFNITVFTAEKGIGKPVQQHGYRQPEKHTDGYFYFPLYFSTKENAPAKIVVIRTYDATKELSAYSDEVSTDDWGGGEDPPPPPIEDSMEFAALFPRYEGASAYYGEIYIYNPTTKAFGADVAPTQDSGHNAVSEGLCFSFPAGKLIFSNYLLTVGAYKYRRLAVSGDKGASWTVITPGSTLGKEATNAAGGEESFAGFGGKIVDTMDGYNCHILGFSDDGIIWREQLTTPCDGQTYKAVDPNNPGKVWLLALGGNNGLYYSENEGAPVLITDTIRQGSIAASKFTANRLYAIYSGNIYRCDGCHSAATYSATQLTLPSGMSPLTIEEIGDGMLLLGGKLPAGVGTLPVWKSTDEGTTWTQVSTSPTIPCGNVPQVLEIEVHPSNPDCVLVLLGLQSGDTNSYSGTGNVVNNGDGTATVTTVDGTQPPFGYCGFPVWLSKGTEAKGFRLISVPDSTHFVVACEDTDLTQGDGYNFALQCYAVYLTTDGFATIEFIAPPTDTRYSLSSYSCPHRQICFTCYGTPAPPQGQHHKIYFGFTNTETDKRGIISTSNCGANVQTPWKDDKLLATPPVGGLATENSDQDILYLAMPIDHAIYGESVYDHAKKSFDGGYDLNGNGKRVFFKNVNQPRQIECAYNLSYAYIVAKRQGATYKRKLYRTENRFLDVDFTTSDWTLIWNNDSIEVVAIAVDKNNDNIIYLFGDDEKIYKSSDSGTTWDTGHATGLSSATWLVVSKDYIFACGDGTNGEVAKRAALADLDTWTQLTIGALTTIEPYGLITGEESQNIVIALSRDDATKGLYLSEDNGATFVKIDGQERYRCGIEIVGRAGTFLVGCNGKIRLLYKRNGVWYCQDVEGDTGSANRNFCFVAGQRKYYGFINPA